MADVQSNIHVNIDTSDALASLKLLQRQISAFHTQMAKSGTAASAVAANQAQNLMNSINATGQFQASMRTVTSSTESFTNALEKNKLTSREYFRYTGAATKTFGRLFRSEFDTINKVARERVKDVQTQYIKMGRGANGALEAIAVRPLTLDMKNLGTQTAIAAQRQQLLNQLLKQGSTNLLNFGKNTQWAGRQLMVGFTVPLAMLGSAAAKTFMAMEEQAIRFKRVYGELFTTQEETDAMVKDIQRLAKEYTKYGVAVEETMKMAADAAAMGKMGVDLTAQVAQATRLAVLGGVEQAQALETTISVTNAFGVATEDLAKKIDFLNAVENQTVVSIEDLTIAIPKAGPVVKQLGGDVEDLAFFLTAMKEGGINASEGANALKSGLASLINPAEKSAKFLAGLGVNINAIVEGNAGDVKATVIEFAQALDTLDPLNRARAIEQLFGKFQFSRLSTLFQNVVAEGNQASRVLQLTKATTEELAILSERELSKIENTTTYKFKKSIEDLKVTLAPVGEQFLKALTPIVEFAAKILDKFNDLGDGSKKFLTILTVALGAVGPVALMAFGLLANGVANIIKLFATMRAGFQRAGSSTQVLGQQTNYLTQEQLEASAVAASLNQVHTRLQQTFTSETAAVNRLALAYRNAIAAQVGFTGPVRGGTTGATQAAKKYSTGTTRVPGTGNQDTVPAVLTPGEAVIPADVAQNPKFKPIINAMVNRRLQGFNGGTSAVVAFGAHQPFTSAHQSIAEQGKLLAAQLDTEFVQYTSAGTQSKKGVVSLENRLKQIEESTGKPPVAVKDMFGLMEDLHSKGVKDVKILLGTDRMQNDVFDEAAKKYGINLEKVEVPRVLDEKNVSATKLREAVAAGNMEEASRLIANGTSEETKKLIFDEIKQNYKPIVPKTEFAHAVDKTTVSVDDIPERFSKDAKIIKGIGKDKASLYTGIGFDIDKNIHKLISQEDIMDKDGNVIKKGAPVESYIEELKKPRAVETMTGNLMKPPTSLTALEASRVTNRIRTNLLAELAMIPEGTLINDKDVYSKMGDAKSGILGALVEQKGTTSTAVKTLLEAQGVSGQGTASKTYGGTKPVEDVIQRLKETKTNPSVLKAFENIAKFEPGKLIEVELDADKKIVGYNRPELSGPRPEQGTGRIRPISEWKFTKKTSAAAYDPETDQFNPKRSTPDSGGLGPKLKPPKKLLEKARVALYGNVDPDTAVTEYKEHISKGTGYSNVVDRDISGLYETKDGKRVFVKPMINLENALAEQRATQIARDVHGLDAPKQRLVVIENPETGKRSYALESPFEERFANVSEKFTKEQYFRQLVASALRGDKDLAKGNLGGNALTDVGTAGIYDEASQYNAKRGEARVISDQVRSFADQAKINLGGVTGSNAKTFFLEATKDIASSMTAEEYSKAVNDEIDRVLPRLKETINNPKSFEPPLTLAEKEPYKQMIARLEAAKGMNWTELWEIHAKGKKVAIGPNEVVLDEKGKPKKPDSEPMGTTKTKKRSQDSRKAAAELAPFVRNVTNIPGKADAPTILNPALAGRIEERRIEELAKKKAIAEADARSRYDTVKPTAYEKSIRRKNDQNERRGLPLVGIRQEPVATVSAVTQELRERAEARAAAKSENARAAATANSRAMYGKEDPTAIDKSIRRKQDKLERQGKPLKALTKQLAAPVSVFSKVLNKATQTVQKNTVASKVLDKFKAKQEKTAVAKAAGMAKPGMGMTGGVMAASGVAMMASMIPGQVGEMAQKIMMPLMGMSMIMPMLQNKFTALAAGIGLITAAYIYQRMQFDKAQDSALKLTEAMGSGAEAMKNLSTFAGKVSAGEIMDRRRKESFSPFQIKTGKTTFGESFVASEQGKAMAQNVGETVRTSGKTVAKAQVANQMATAVASGALSAKQARSIVANLAQEMGDYSFGIEVNAKLIELLGPNGENLMNDPLGIRVKILKDTRERMNLTSDAARKAGGVGNFTKEMPSFGKYLAGGVAAGAGIGAAVGGIPTAGAGAVPGAAAGGVIGGITAGLSYLPALYKANIKYQKNIGVASGANVAMQKIALEQQSEMIDSLDLEYQTKLAAAKASGDQAEQERLTTEYIKNRKGLLVENAQLVKDIQTNFANAEGATRTALMTGADKAITNKYKGTAMEDVAPLATTMINDSGVSQEKQYVLKMQLASGQMDPMQMLEVFETFKDDKKSINAVLNIIGKFGGKFANQVMGIVGMFKDPKQSADFVARIKTMSPAKAQKELELFQRISQSDSVVGANVLLNYYNKNPIAAENLQKSLDKIDELNGKITMQIATTVLGADEMAALRADQVYFDSLPPEQQKVYLQNMKVMFSMQGDAALQEQYKNWAAEEGNKGKTFAQFVTAKTFQVTESSKDDTAAPKKKNTSGGGSKVESSPLDDLVKKLRDVRMNQLKVTEGWGASQKALNKLFGGSKTIEIFSGIENDMRKLGAGEDLIDLITGMDPKEYEKRKKSLFEFDAKGNIKKIKDNARSIGDAIASISLGEFVSEQERMSKQIGNQTTALTRLKAAGIEGSVALEAVADATFAAAIANKKLSDKQIKQIAKTWQEATKNKKNYAAVQTIEAEKTALQERADLLTNITAIMGTLSEAERDAVLSNDALSSALANLKNLKPGDKAFASFLDLIQKTLNKNRVELKINRLSLDGLQETFDAGFNAAMEKADVDEKTLQLKFQADTKTLNEQIDLAQDVVNKLNYDIDDQEAILRGIEKQEEKINEKYDERIDALGEVEKANAAISAQQKGQLTLAEALTSGDIAAAARAAQEMRTQAAADAVTKEKEALEKSREYELSKVRQDGKSREDVEKEIERLQDLVFIQEEKIEKDQEEIRIKEVALRKALIPIDERRTKWETLQNEIDIERTSNERFMKLMTDAEAIVEELKRRYRNLKVDTDPIVGAGTLVPGPGPGPGPGPDPVGPCGPGYFMNQEGKCIQIEKDETVVEGTGPCGPGYFMNQEGKCLPVKKDDDGPGGKTDTTPVGFKETAPDPYKNTWMNIKDLTAQAHVKDMETNIAANIVRNSELFNREVNKLKIEDNAGTVAKNHYTDLTRLTDAMNLAKKYNTGPDYAKQQAENLAANKAAAAKKAQDEATLKKFGGNFAAAQAFGNWSTGGLIPKYFAVGGFAKGTDTVPAMLTPGEFIMSKYAVDTYGVDNMRKINNGDSIGGTVYNNTYTLTVNAKTDANPNDIAQAVMSTIKRVDDRRIRGVALNGR
jgi:TP901 family phage tail tape measure protein